MAFELNLKFTERLYLSDVSITSKNWKKGLLPIFRLSVKDFVSR